jgi:hypothetical protein
MADFSHWNSLFVEREGANFRHAHALCDILEKAHTNLLRPSNDNVQNIAKQDGFILLWCQDRYCWHTKKIIKKRLNQTKGTSCSSTTFPPCLDVNLISATCTVLLRLLRPTKFLSCLIWLLEIFHILRLLINSSKYNLISLDLGIFCSVIWSFQFSYEFQPISLRSSAAFLSCCTFSRTDSVCFTSCKQRRKTNTLSALIASNKRIRFCVSSLIIRQRKRFDKELKSACSCKSGQKSRFYYLRSRRRLFDFCF